jgi:hypothetical protein
MFLKNLDFHGKFALINSPLDITIINNTNDY